MTDVLVVAERLRGKVDDGVAELATAARRLAGGGSIAAAVIGHEVSADAASLARLFDRVFVFDDPAFETPDGERDGSLLRTLAEREGFALLLFLHGNQTLDLAPSLAGRLGRPMLSDVLDVEWDDGRLVARRTVYGGKLVARVSADASDGALVSIRAGAFPPASEDADGEIREEVPPEDLSLRRRPLRTVEPDPGAVDITAAEIVVGVGRGIEEEENLELVQDLAAALGGELACSRPVVDKGWLPKTRQVGTSGVTVKPKLYVAVGISGSFQHMGGVKGTPFIVAVNKDAKAPIFDRADVGVVGDLFDVVPAVTERVKQARA